MTPVDPLAVAASVARVLDRLGIVHTIGGSIAASFAGEPRSTVDIDIVAALDDARVADVVAALSPDFYVDEDAVRRAVRTRTSVNLIHHATMLKVDVFVAGGTPVDTEQLQRRLRVRLDDGTDLPIHPPEDILLQKLRWFRLGTNPSRIVSEIARRAFIQLSVGVIVGGGLSAAMLWAFDDRYLNAGVLRTANWPVTVGVIAAAVMVVGMLACVKPTLRAIRIRPMEALRS